MWIQILRNKYLHSKTLAQVSAKPMDSPFWKGLMRTNVSFFQQVKFLVGNGTTTRFWEDTWLGEMSLALQYPSLYNIVQRKEDYVATVLNSVPLNIRFRRSLVGEHWDAWLQLVCRLMDIQLSDQADTIRCNLTSPGVFSVKSMYLDLIDSGPLSRSLYI